MQYDTKQPSDGPAIIAKGKPINSAIQAMTPSLSFMSIPKNLTETAQANSNAKKDGTMLSPTKRRINFSIDCFVMAIFNLTPQEEARFSASFLLELLCVGSYTLLLKFI